MNKKQDTLFMIFLSAIAHLYPKALVKHEGAFSSGMYLEIDGLEINETICLNIKQQMGRYILNDEAIHQVVVDEEEQLKIFKKHKMFHSVALWQQKSNQKRRLFELDGYYSYFLDELDQHCNVIETFFIYPYQQGIWLSLHDDFKPQAKLFEAFQNGQQWGDLVKVSYIDELNDCVKNNTLDELVLMSETLYEVNLYEIAKDIVKKADIKFVLIAGPSSAGKTTTSKRLCNHLKLLGKKPITIEMDAFYKTNDQIPIMANGQRDFEGFDAFDDQLFNETLVKLLNHEAVHMPIYLFGKGIRLFEEEPLQLKQDQILIIEGIHGLNPKATSQISDDRKYKIYINALTHINVSEHERIQTNEIRLMRRMYRDMLFRNTTIEKTLQMWDNVRKGESENIFPYQEEANKILNTSLCYELPILKYYLQPHLEQITLEDERLSRIKTIFTFVEASNSQALPKHSILAEFIGNSIFK